jgi:tetratricopeptide (TPR) repeat protein
MASGAGGVTPGVKPGPAGKGPEAGYVPAPGPARRPAAGALLDAGRAALAPGRALLRVARRRPWLSLAAGLALLAGGAAAGAHLWALAEYDAAGRDIRDEHYAAARARLRTCAAVWPWSTAPHLLAARAARLEGYYDEAEAELKKVKDLQGGPSDAYQLEQVLIRAQRGDVDPDTLADLRYAVNHGHPESAAILDAVALGHLHHMRLLPALECYNVWLKLDPDAVRALDGRGWIDERIDRHVEAQRDYLRAIELAPGRSGVRRRLASLLLDDNDPEAALAHYRRLQQDEPDAPDVLTGLARCRALLNQPDEARRLFDRVLDADPDYHDALLFRGKLEFQEKNYRAAEKDLRLSLKSQTDDPEVYFALYNCVYAQPGREEEAQKLFAQWQSTKKDLERMSALLKGEVDRDPKNPGPPSELGALFLKMGHDDQGRYWLRVAEDRNPDHAPTLRAWVGYYEKKGDPDRAKVYRDRLRAAEAGPLP